MSTTTASLTIRPPLPARRSTDARPLHTGPCCGADLDATIKHGREIEERLLEPRRVPMTPLAGLLMLGLFSASVALVGWIVVRIYQALPLA